MSVVDGLLDCANVVFQLGKILAKKVLAQLEDLDLRGSIDERNEKTGKKIRDAEVAKIPFMLIVGEKEQEEGTVSVRRHGEGDLGVMKSEEFATLVNNMVAKELE